MKINLITTCAGSKIVEPPKELQFKNLPSNDTFNKWVNLINSSKTKYPAISLYKGGYWNVIKEIDNIVDNTYILSGGCGLIKSTDKIPSYSIGFKPDNADYVGHKGFKRNEWWNLINPNNKLSTLIKNNPNDKFILYVSFSYMKAIKDDILEVINSPNLYIFSPDTKGKDFKPYILNTSLKMRHILGGNTMNITALTIKYFLENVNSIGWNKDNINNHFTNLVKDLPDVFGDRFSYKRKKTTDDNIIKMIYEIDPNLNSSPKKIQEYIWSKGFSIGPNRLFKILNQENDK